MTAVDLLERTRMALAEAGYPNADVKRDSHLDGEISILLSGPNGVPDEVCWRAHGVVAMSIGDVPPCWECWDKATPDACLADRVLVRDCGVTR